MQPKQSAEPMDPSAYENFHQRLQSKQASRAAEYSKLYSSTSIAGQLQHGSYASGYIPPNVDDMQSIRRSLDSTSNINNIFPRGGPQSIWQAARETSQSLEFDVGRPQRSSHDMASYDSGWNENVGASNVNVQNNLRPPPPPGDNKAQIELERRLAKLEMENEKLKKNQAALLKKQAGEGQVGQGRQRKTTGAAVTSRVARKVVVDDNYGDDGEAPANESEALSMIRKSVEKGLSVLTSIDTERQQKITSAERRIKQNSKELLEMKKEAEKYKREAEGLKTMIGGAMKTTKTTKTTTTTTTPTSAATSFDADRFSKKGSRSARPKPAPSAPGVEIPTTRAAKLREAKRQAEKDRMNATGDSDNGNSLDDDFNSFNESTYLKKMDWSFMGPRPADPSTIQRVDRQRDIGSDARDISPKRSKDFDRMCSANRSVEADSIRKEGHPLDWSVLMGTEERKKKIINKEDVKIDPSYEEVKGIIAHCRGSDNPLKEVLALLPKEIERLDPPLAPTDGSHNFKKRLSKLFIGLKIILESNAEKQVKYVTFKQRCNLHTKDLEGVLARRAIATMAYSFGAVNSSHLGKASFSDFLRSFWNDNPQQFPIYEGDILHLWELCDAGDTALLSEMVFVQPYIERNTFGFEFNQQCWGRPRDGLMRLRSAGFEAAIDPENIPAKVIYGYCKSTVMPPMDWDCEDIKRGMKVPTQTLDLERVYGCLGKTICPNLYETYEGKAVFSVAAVAVIQHVESGAQRFYNNHTDDITCIGIHYAGKICVTGQMGKPCYALVWSLETFETLFRIGDGYFERMVQAAAISPNERYLVGVGGDNNQSVGIFDLKAVDDVTGELCPVLVAESQFGPGVPPIVTFLEWKPGLPGVTFVGIAGKSKLLKFWDFEPENEEKGLPILSERKGIASRDVRELSSAAWAMDGSILITGTDIGDVLIWTGVTVTQTIKAYEMVRKNYISVTAVAFTPEGDKLYTGGSDGKLKVWTYPEGELIDTHNLALSRSDLALKTGATNAVAKKPKKPKDRGIPGAPKEAATKVEKTIVNSKAINNIIVLDNKKVIKGDPQTYEQVVVMTEKGMLLNVWDDSNGDTQFRSMMASHYGEVSGLGVHPFNKGQFATCGEDGLLNVWNADEKVCVKTVELNHPARNCCYSPDGKWIAVGFCDGYLGIYFAETLVERSEVHFLREDIDALKFSPDGNWLATGSHDNYIDLIDCRKEKFAKVHRFKGHTSYITHLDFSTDSRMLMSNCGAGEILYWDVLKRRQLRSKAEMVSDPNDPKTWGRMTCVLGFPVMGIWPDFSDGTDVNALHVNEKGDVCITSDDFGEVKVFNFPCVTEDACFRAYKGHSSFVNNCAFAPGDNHVISCGSADLSVMQWRFTYEKKKGEQLKKAMSKMVVSNAFKGSYGKSFAGQSKEGGGTGMDGVFSSGGSSGGGVGGGGFGGGGLSGLLGKLKK